jgi:lipoprotein-releasing system ATP-binding protein
VTILAPSGSGKSTLLNIIGSLDEPTAGRVMLGETEITALQGTAQAAFRGTRVGFVFQDHHLLPQCTAAENVLLPTLSAGASTQDAADRAAQLLERVGLGDRLGSFPSRLSGGERQRVAVARALINRPRLLLCDEPTGNLDQDTGARIGELFAELVEESDVMLICVTHNREFGRRFERVFELREGELHQVDG